MVLINRLGVRLIIHVDIAFLNGTQFDIFDFDNLTIPGQRIQTSGNMKKRKIGIFSN